MFACQKGCTHRAKTQFSDAVIAPTVLFGLSTTPLTMMQLSHIVVAWRGMLRSIVGWVPVINGHWRSVMVTMNQKFAAAKRLFSLEIVVWEKF